MLNFIDKNYAALYNYTAFEKAAKSRMIGFDRHSSKQAKIPFKRASNNNCIGLCHGYHSSKQAKIPFMRASNNN
jgi:hypothetical protein